MSLLEKLEQVTSSLQSHYYVVAFVGWGRSCVLNNLSEASVAGVPRTATGSSARVGAYHHVVGEDGFKASEQVVHAVHMLEVIIADSPDHLFELTLNVPSSKAANESFSQNWRQNVLLRLVVEGLTLFLGAVLCFELATAGIVPQSNLECLRGVEVGIFNDTKSDCHHDSVHNT